MTLESYTLAQVSQHNSESDCWIIVHNSVYDVTKFLKDHPGGKKVILKVAGTDATKQFDAFHNAGVMDKFGPELIIGTVAGDAPKKAVVLATTEDGSSLEPFGDLIPFGDPSWYQDGVKSPYYNDSHRRFRKAIRDFVDREIMPHCHEWDEARQVPRNLFLKYAQNNLFCLSMGSIPDLWEYVEGEKIMGFLHPKEADMFHELILNEELARAGSGGILWALTGGLSIGLPPVLLFGSKELKRRVAPECLSGRKSICLAITEPYAGSDVANIRCEAKETPDGSHYIVNGEKKWITNGVWCDYFTVAVRTGADGQGGISLLLIEKSMPGVTTRQMKCSGVWCSGTTYITFEDVKVPKENLIGVENEGFKYIMYNFNHERLGLIIQCTRLARVCVEESIKYAHKRKTFGQRLIDHQVIRFKIASMARRVEATHAWLEQVVYRYQVMNHKDAMMKLGGPIALLKVQATQTFELCAREAAQIFGGLSYTRGGQGEKVERLYREVRAYAIPGGSEEIMEELGVKQSIKSAKLLGAKL